MVYEDFLGRTSFSKVYSFGCYFWLRFSVDSLPLYITMLYFLVSLIQVILVLLVAFLLSYL